jgi:spermidine synthase
LYTQEFYETVVKRALRPGGIFVTQAGPAGVLACTAVFTVIHNTLGNVFPKVVPYTAAVPSYADAWVCPCVWPLDNIKVVVVAAVILPGSQYQTPGHCHLQCCNL